MKVGYRNFDGMRLRVNILSLLICLALNLCLLNSPSLGQKKTGKQNLVEPYKSWLERDVAYIITRTEHDAFLRLTTNDERDKFMADFWELRNPTPGAPT